MQVKYFILLTLFLFQSFTLAAEKPSGVLKAYQLKKSESTQYLVGVSSWYRPILNLETGLQETTELTGFYVGAERKNWLVDLSAAFWKGNSQAPTLSINETYSLYLLQVSYSSELLRNLSGYFGGSAGLSQFQVVQRFQADQTIQSFSQTSKWSNNLGAQMGLSYRIKMLALGAESRFLRSDDWNSQGEISFLLKAGLNF